MIKSPKQGEVYIIGNNFNEQFKKVEITGIFHNGKWTCNKCHQTFNEPLECNCWKKEVRYDD